MNLIFTHTRVPSLTLPVAVNAKGLPLGIQPGARKHSDPALLAAAREIERVIVFRAFCILAATPEWHCCA